MNSGVEGAANFIFFWSIELGQFFFTKYMANDEFSEPTRRAGSKKVYFHLLLKFGSWSPPGPRGQSQYDFGGGVN